MRPFVILALGTLLLSNLAYGEEPKGGLAGTWTVVAMERAGRKPPKELLEKNSLKVVIQKNSLRISDDKRGEGATFTINEKLDPPTIDLVFKEGEKENVERKAVGIFKLEGDNLTFAWRKDGGARPKEFSSLRGERTSELWVLKRKKAE